MSSGLPLGFGFHPIRVANAKWLTLPTPLRLVLYMVAGGLIASFVAQRTPETPIANFSFAVVTAVFLYGLSENRVWAKIAAVWLVYLMVFMAFGVYLVLNYFHGTDPENTRITLDFFSIGLSMISIGLVSTAVSVRWSKMTPWIPVAVTLIVAVPAGGSLLVEAAPALGILAAWVAAGVSLTIMTGMPTTLIEYSRLWAGRKPTTPPQPAGTIVYTHPNLPHTTATYVTVTEKGSVFLVAVIAPDGDMKESPVTGITFPGVPFSRLTQELVTTRRTIEKRLRLPANHVGCAIVATPAACVPHLVGAEVTSSRTMKRVGTVWLVPADTAYDVPDLLQQYDTRLRTLPPLPFRRVAAKADRLWEQSERSTAYAS